MNNDYMKCHFPQQLCSCWLLCMCFSNNYICQWSCCYAIVGQYTDEPADKRRQLIKQETEEIKLLLIYKMRGKTLSSMRDMIKNRASWFRRQPHFNEQETPISNVFFLGDSSGMPVMPVDILCIQGTNHLNIIRLPSPRALFQH